ncbi:MAG: helix-turn-helix domain-containing protein [Patescibacteria group bacterium]|nr:helix-turn-helix domain-containing protein [Patescibacteria group bacterium]
MVKKLLSALGLTEKQALVYLACLELGTSPAHRISQRAGLPRSTTYEILSSLQQKGFASVFFKKTIKYFSAEEPKRVISETQSRIDLLKNALPQIEARYLKARGRPQVRFYQGKVGIQNVLEEILEDTPREVFGFSAVDDFFNSLDDYFPSFVERRVKRKIFAKLIMSSSMIRAKETKTLDAKQLRESRIISSPHQHHGSILIWKNKIALMSLKDEFEAVVVEGAELATVQKTMFNIFWDSLPN